MALAQMGKDGMGKSGMMGDGMMGSGGKGMGMMGMHGPGMEMGGMGEMMKMMRAVSKLNLTADQTKKLQLSTLQHQKEAIPLFGQIRLAGVEIQELLLAEPANLDKVKSKVKGKYDAAAKLEMSHLALMQEVKKLLTPEQRQRLESMMMEMGPMMGSSSGQAQDDQALQGAPNGPTDDASDSKDPHGHRGVSRSSVCVAPLGGAGRTCDRRPTIDGRINQEGGIRPTNWHCRTTGWCMALHLYRLGTPHCLILETPTCLPFEEQVRLHLKALDRVVTPRR